MRFGRTDARHNALAHTGQNGVLAGTTYQLVYVGTHRNAGFGYELNAIFGHSCHGGCVYYFRIDTRLHSLEHITPARSMAVAFSNERSMLAFDADTSAYTTRCTCPPVM